MNAKQKRAAQAELSAAVAEHRALEERIANAKKLHSAEVDKLKKLNASFDPTRLGERQKLSRCQAKVDEVGDVLAGLESLVFASKLRVQSAYRQLHPAPIRMLGSLGEIER